MELQNKGGRPAKPENRTRTRNLVIRMSDEERGMLDAIAERLDLPNASEAFRHLVRREFETTKPSKRSAR